MSLVGDIVGGIFGGGDQADAARDASNQQVAAARAAIAASERAADKGLGFLEGFSGIKDRGISESNFLANPQAQFNYLQSNPLFDLALNNANQQTNARAASQGRLNSGDTLQQLSNNVLLSAQPLINDQRQDVNNLLNLGFGTAQTQANTAINQGSTASNLLTDIGAAQAAGTIGAQNARDQGTQNLLNLGGALFTGGAFSDPRLKENKAVIGAKNGHNVWSWTWNKKANELFDLFGESYGVMADEVQRIMPEAVNWVDGYRKVNYDMIGVSHGS